MNTPNELLVAIPVYNEERYLQGVIEEVKRFASDILVIDDGSTDSTPKILTEHPELAVLTHPENRGYGKSLADAFCYAIRHGFRWLITMDCDEQHEASYIPRFLARAAQEDADVISGTRYPSGTDTSGVAPEDRRKINQQITAMINARLGLNITDAFCGFKAYRVSTLNHFQITVPGYAMPMQFWVQAARAGIRVAELPVRLIYNDPTRHFGGILDDPIARLAHYLEVFEVEYKVAAPAKGAASSLCQPCQ